MRWSLALVRALAVLALWIGGDSGVFSQDTCTCSTQDLCRPVPADHQHQVEVIVFYRRGTDWIHFDWSKVTTVVALNSPQADLVCHAHANKVRVVQKEFIQNLHLTNIEERANWIQNKMHFAKLHFLDGINLEKWKNVSNYPALFQLLRETTDVFHKQIPGSQINNAYHEVWYDDPESLSLKSLIVKKLKLRGIGAWTANYLNYTGDPATALQTEEMWNALCPIRRKWRT